ncbi:MAG: IclR family transcriptional regulator [Lautropia sp.]
MRSNPRNRDSKSGDGGDPADSRDAQLSTTLTRGLRVLEAFRSNDDGPLGNREVAQRTGLHKATVSRLVHTLASLGYVSIDPKTGGYSLAPGVLSFSHVFLSRLDIRATARPLLQRLAAPAGTTVVLAMRDRLMMTTIEAFVADPRFQLRAWVGASAPIALAASGHAHLAGLAPERRAELLQRLQLEHAQDWPVVSQRIERSLQSVAARGFCLELGEWKPHINDVAVPVVLDAAHHTVLTIACGGPPQLLPQDKLEELGTVMVSLKQELEYLLAGRM